MNAKDLLEFGVKYPYDADDSGATRQGDWADKVARGIIADLTDRRDIKHGFNRVDHDIRCEIVETLASIVREGAVDLLIEHDRYKVALEQLANAGDDCDMDGHVNWTGINGSNPIEHAQNALAGEE